MTYKESKQWLYSLKFKMHGFDLKNMKRLVKAADIDLNSFKTIHVAGSNGKGSTCAFIANILAEHGYRTGLYTSPHLVEPTERMQINGKKISEKRFAELCSRFRKLVKQKKLEATHFEIMTAMALKYFEEEKIDFLVAETGMGGRLDATNVLHGMVNVITKISLEHTQYLGKTIAKIASEKAGIIKENSIVVTHKNNPGEKIIRKRAKEKSSELIEPVYKIIESNASAQEFYLTKPTKLKGLKISMIGEHQCENAALAIAAILALGKKGFAVSEKALRNGLEKTKWRARLEVVSIKPLIILDSSHNNDGWKTSFKALKLFKHKKLIVVTGAMKDKDISELKKQLKNADKVIITKVDFFGAETPERLRKKLGIGKILVPAEKAVKIAIESAGKNDLVLVTGSIYVTGKAYEALRIKI